jgi:hypothetical protein
VDRPPAALILTAPDLAEFVKFLPEVRKGLLGVHRLVFLLPLAVAALALPPLVVAPRLAYPGWARWAVCAAVIPLALSLLPPVWSPAVLLSSEFRLQALACLACLGLVVFSRWLPPLPLPPLLALLIPACAAAPALALWQFFAVSEAVARAYAGPVGPGWGAAVTAAGFGAAVLAALLRLWALRVDRKRPMAHT